MKRGIGILLIVKGIVIILSSFSGITGLAIGEGNSGKFISIIGLVLVAGGIALVSLRSIIKEDNGLVREAEDAGNNQRVQVEIDHLTGELSKGNTNAGLGTSKLFGNISYLRGRNGARVFYRPAGEGYEILAKSSKDNEPQVINKLIDRYGTKTKTKTA